MARNNISTLRIGEIFYCPTAAGCIFVVLPRLSEAEELRLPGRVAGQRRSDSLNISPRARWVVCTPSGLYTPGVFEKRRKKIPFSNGRFESPPLHGR